MTGLANDYAPKPDFQTRFATLPRAYLVFTPDLLIVDANDAYLKTTMTRREDILGRNVFHVFPENPQAPKSSAMALRSSIQLTIETRSLHTLWRQRYDVPRKVEHGVVYEERY